MTLFTIFAVTRFLPLFLPVYDVDFLLHRLPHKMGNGGVFPYRQLLNLVPHFHRESDAGQGLFHRFYNISGGHVAADEPVQQITTRWQQ